MRIAFNRKNFLANLYLFTLVFLVPVFDSATGLLVRGETMSSGGLGTPSQLIRFFIIFLSVLIIQSKRGYALLIIGSVYLFTIELVAFLFHQSFQGLLIGVVFAYKFIFSVFVFFALKKIFEKLHYTEKDIIQLVVKAASVLCICFLLGDLVAIRVGISTSVFRSSGLFSSGNGLGVLLGVFSLLMLYGFEKNYLSGRYPKYIFTLTLVCLLLIATKASAIFMTLNLVFLLARLSLVYKMVVFSLIGVVVIFFFKPLVEFLNVAFELAIWRYENMTSWANFILSAREDYITDAMASFNSTSYKFVRIIFGAGSFLSFESPAHYTMRYKMMEMDSFDTFFMYGVIGVLVYLTAMVYCIKKTVFKSRILACATIALFLHSIFAGHTMYNGLAATGVVFIFLLIQDNKEGRVLPVDEKL